MEWKVRPMTMPEQMYCYRQSQQIMAQCGCIGYLRVDMDTNGEGFFSSWEDHAGYLKSEQFKEEFDELINDLRFGEENAWLKNRTALAAFCRNHPAARMEGAEENYGLRVDTENFTYIIQNLAQLKALFEKKWESIVGNCDECLYLGGNEQSTHEYVSKLLGKETIDTNTYGQSRGRNGSYSTNWQIAGRELMTPDEVRMLDNRYALLFIRGEYPVEDFKYDILKHPNIGLTTDGGAAPYRHGEDLISIASLRLNEHAFKNAADEAVSEDEYLFFCEEELEELLQKKMEELRNEQKEQQQ